MKDIEWITSLSAKNLLDDKLSSNQRLAVIAACCATQVMVDVAPKEHGKPEWPRQIGDGVTIIAESIYSFLEKKK